MCWIGWDILSLFFVFGEILSNFDPEKYDFNLGSQILFFFLNSLVLAPFESGGVHKSCFFIVTSTFSIFHRISSVFGHIHMEAQKSVIWSQLQFVSFEFVLKKGAKLCNCFVSKKMIKYVYINKIIINTFLKKSYKFIKISNNLQSSIRI